TAAGLFVPAGGLLAAGPTGAAVSAASRCLIGCTGAAIGALAHGLLRAGGPRRTRRRRPVGAPAAAAPAGRRRIRPLRAVLRQAAAPPRSGEGWIVALAGQAAVLVGLLAGLRLALDEERWTAAVCLLLLGAAAWGHAVLLSRRRHSAALRALPVAAGSLAGAAAGAAGASLLLPEPEGFLAPLLALLLLGPPPATAAALWRRGPLRLRRAAAAGLIAASLPAAAGLLVLIWTAGPWGYLDRLAASEQARTLEIAEPLGPGLGLGLGAVLGVCAAAAIVRTAGGQLLRRAAAALLPIGVLGGLAAAGHLGGARRALAASILLACLALALRFLDARRPDAPGAAASLAGSTVALAIACLGAFTMSLVSFAHMAIALAALALVLAAARFTWRGAGRPLCTAAFVIVVHNLAWIAPMALCSDGSPGLYDFPVAEILVGMLAGATLLLLPAALLPRRGIGRVERFLLVSGTLPAFLAGFLLVLEPTFSTRPMSGLPPLLSWLLQTLPSASLVALLLAIVFRFRADTVRTPDRPERRSVFSPAVAALLPAATGILTVAILSGAVYVPQRAVPEAIYSTDERYGDSVFPVLCLVGLAFAAIALLLRRRGARWNTTGLDLGVLGLAFLCAAPNAFWLPHPSLRYPLILAIASGAVLLIASGREGLLRARGQRRHLAWTALAGLSGAWTEAVAAAWPQAHPALALLPVAALWLAAGLLLWLRGRAWRERRASAGGIAATGVGLFVLWPLAPHAALQTSPWESLVLLGAAGLGLLCVAAAPWPRAARFYAVALMLGTGSLMLYTAVTRLAAEDLGEGGLFGPLPWLGTVFAIGAIALLLAAERVLPPAGSALGAVLLATTVLAPGILFTADGPHTAAGVLLTLLVALFAALLPAWPYANLARGLVAAIATLATAPLLLLAWESGPLARELVLGIRAAATIGIALAVLACLLRQRHDPARTRAATLAALPLAMFFAAASTIIAVQSLIPPAADPGVVPLLGPAVGSAIGLLCVCVSLVFGPGLLTTADRRPFLVSAALLGLLTPLLNGFSQHPGPWLLTGLAAVAAGSGPRRLPRPLLGPVRWAGTAIVAVSAWQLAERALPAERPALLAFVAGCCVLLAGGIVTIGGSATGEAARREHRVERMLVLALGGTLALPLAAVLEGAQSSPVLSIAIAAVSATVVLAIASSPLSEPLRSAADAVAAAAATALLLLPAIRTMAHAGSPETVLVAGLVWTPPALGLLLLAAFLRARRGLPGDERSAVVLACAATLGIALAGVLHTTFSPEGLTASLLGAGWVLTALAVVLASVLREAVPLDRRTAWSGVVASGAVAAIGLTVADPIEWVTVTAGAAGVLIGSVLLRRRPELRSWPTLAPGVLALLVPSVVVGLSSGGVWRIAAIAVLAFGVLLWGLLARLQAPFLLGAGVLAVHSFAFWPQLEAVTLVVPWWGWLALAGLVLVTLAARYERSLRDAKRAVAAISAMR
ncbi:MAG: hypothetical protein Q4E05_11520, partial [Pseudoclavibacter sp.]|nr:hypothetical protein [Pseudoclavibacter sp.]